MERLTRHHFKKQDGFYMTCSEHCSKEDFSCEDCGELDKLVDRLGTIEDILGDDYDLERLRELVEADRDGRCVVLPCKVGDSMYDIRTGKVTEKTVISIPFLLSKSVNYLQLHAINSRDASTTIETEDLGKTVFLTSEEAQAALERMKSNG